jgi:TnpA family transposase
MLRTVDTAIIREQWDQLVRIAASLRDRSAPAHVIVDRLAAASSDRPARALTMLGRIVKTPYVLRYLHDPAVRDRVHLQLNRGESRHALAKRISFGNQCVFRSGDVNEIMNKVSALALLSNAVLVWNTVRIAAIVKELEASSGQPVPRNELARISPLLSARLLVSGRYHFESATPPPEE